MPVLAKPPSSSFGSVSGVPTAASPIAARGGSAACVPSIRPAASRESRQISKELASLKQAKEPIEALQERVDALSTWGQEWSDYDAPPPSETTIRWAIAWVVSLHREVVGASLAWSDPLITASEDSEVVFDWWQHDKRLTVYVGETGAMYSTLWGRPPALFTDDGEVNTHAAMIRLWRWLES